MVGLITGGDSGIGRAVAIAFAKEGADVAIVYLNEHEDARDTKRAVEELGQRCILIAGDVGDPEFCADAVSITVEEFGKLAVRKGLDGVIAPVRPSEKHRHPFIPMEEYLEWTDEKGRIYDPWLRSHMAAGGKIIRPAPRSFNFSVAGREVPRRCSHICSGRFRESAFLPRSHRDPKVVAPGSQIFSGSGYS